MQIKVTPLNHAHYQRNSASITHVLLKSAAILLVGGLFLAGVVSEVAGRGQADGNSRIVITDNDLRLLVSSESAEYRRQLAKDQTMRKLMVRVLRDMLSASEEAKASGFADRADIKWELEQTRAKTIADNYWKSRGEKATASATEIEAFFTDALQTERYDKFVKKNHGDAAKLSDEQRQAIKRELGVMWIGEQRGTAAGIHQQRSVEIQIIFNVAGQLATLYQQEILVPMVEPTDADVDKYLVKHPKEARAEAREIVRAEKRLAKINDITDRHRARIIMPDDFTVQSPSLRR